jgi:hypothetical protein
MPESPVHCLYCERTSAEVPLIPLLYRDQPCYLCPAHLPLLIHHPEQLADRLPGVEHRRTNEEPG